ncbi:MAG: sulfite exporter TauE/SafE family protein [Burkholderiaceae bacterium]|nr:MAG: sulfite exporter TauE/SafE family protein [Burkholderiaceae bacterium]
MHFEFIDLALAAALFAAAALYSSVGHGGASGYLAMMGLFAVPPAVMRPSALLMNVVVASLAIWRFSTREPFQWRLFVPFVLGSIPLAYVGGRITLPGHWYDWLIGAVLIYAAWRMLVDSRKAATAALQPPPWPVALAVGALLGLLSGLVGVGGGIFLSPLIVLFGWASVRASAAPVAAFILVNSLAGLAGLISKQPELPTQLPLWLGSVVIGGWLGATWGSRHSSPHRLRQALALVLLVAGVKMLLK